MSPAATRVVLVRHAESEWNASGRFQGHQGAGLSRRGAVQAEATAAHLAVIEPAVGLIVRSDLQRVAESAAPAESRFPDVDVLVDERLREVDVGYWSGLSHEEIAERDPDGFRAWRDGRDLPRGGGETLAEMQHRVLAALDDAAARVGAGTVLVFTHGGPVRAAVTSALGLSVTDRRRLSTVANGSLTVLEFADGHRSVLTFNATGHLAAVRGKGRAQPV